MTLLVRYDLFDLAHSDVKESSIITISIFRRPTLSYPKRRAILMGDVSISVREIFTGNCTKVGAYFVRCYLQL
jgi:hypothetical protein